MNMKQIINNAIKTAKCDGYNQVIYTDKDGECLFSRDYPDNNMYEKENIIGKVLTGWNKGIFITQYVKY